MAARPHEAAGIVAEWLGRARQEGAGSDLQGGVGMRVGGAAVDIFVE